MICVLYYFYFAERPTPNALRYPDTERACLQGYPDTGADPSRRSGLIGDCVFYPTAVPSLKIGRYMATTSPPRITPRKAMIIGSMSAVMFVTRLSTSSS